MSTTWNDTIRTARVISTHSHSHRLTILLATRLLSSFLVFPRSTGSLPSNISRRIVSLWLCEYAEMTCADMVVWTRGLTVSIPFLLYQIRIFTRKQQKSRICQRTCQEFVALLKLVQLWKRSSNCGMNIAILNTWCKLLLSFKKRGSEGSSIGKCD